MTSQDWTAEVRYKAATAAVITANCQYAARSRGSSARARAAVMALSIRDVAVSRTAASMTTQPDLDGAWAQYSRVFAREFGQGIARLYATLNRSTQATAGVQPW